MFLDVSVFLLPLVALVAAALHDLIGETAETGKLALRGINWDSYHDPTYNLSPFTLIISRATIK